MGLHLVSLSCMKATVLPGQDQQHEVLVGCLATFALPVASQRLGRLLIMLELLERGALGRAFSATELRKLSR